MATKNLKTRIQNKHDTEANWAKATTFKPLAGELIIYDKDSNNAKPRFKVGDGTTTVTNLPFVAIDYDSRITSLVGSVDFTLTAYTDDLFFDEQNAATWEHNSVIGGKALTSTTDIGLLIGNSYTLGVNLQGTTTLFRATAEEGSPYGWPGIKILWFKRENIATQFFIYDHCTIVDGNLKAGNGCIFVADLSSDITIADIAGFGGDRGIINPATISNSAIKINSAVTMYINTDNVINGTKTDGSITLTASSIGSVNYELEIFATTTEGLFEIINKYKLTESTISNWGFTKNVGTVTAVVVNGYHYDPEGGTVDLGTVLTSHQSIRTLNTNNNTSQTVSASESISGSGTINLHKVAKTGSYNDLLNTPNPVTESTVSSWGFTKNTGTVTSVAVKMNGAEKGKVTSSGTIDLGTVLTDASKFATSAQGTKADTALQSETDPTVPTWAKTPSKPKYTASEVGALSLDGGTINKSKTVKMDASANSDGANLKWGTVNSKNPYIGYASDQVDGTFVVGSLLGTNYASGLAIGGGSGNLLWKGAKVATTSDIPNISGKLDKTAFSLSGTTLTITI